MSICLHQRQIWHNNSSGASYRSDGWGWGRLCPFVISDEEETNFNLDLEWGVLPDEVLASTVFETACGCTHEDEWMILTFCKRTRYQGAQQALRKPARSHTNRTYRRATYPFRCLPSVKRIHAQRTAAVYLQQSFHAAPLPTLPPGPSPLPPCPLSRPRPPLQPCPPSPDPPPRCSLRAMPAWPSPHTLTDPTWECIFHVCT